MLYEADACFASQPGQLAKSPETIRQSLRSFIDMKNGKLDLKVKRVLQTSDLALVTTEWSFSGTGPDGITTLKLLHKLNSITHGQAFLKRAEREKLIERKRIPKPKGQKGNHFIVNRITEKGKRLLQSQLLPFLGEGKEVRK